MPISTRARWVVRLACAAIPAVGSFLVMSAPGPVFSIHDKAQYADANLVSFIRPGLTVKIISANVGTDGTIQAQFRLTDPKGLPLDRDGVVTPGAVTTRLIAAYIPKGQAQYSNYILNATKQPATDTGGLFEKTGDGEYRYTFAAKAPATDDRTVTHSIGIQASRNLTEFGLGTYVDNDVFTFVPDGSKVTVTRDVVRTATCNQHCHDPLAVHGGNRRKIEMCVLCHQPQNVDPNTGMQFNFPVLIHKIHRGADLPSVRAGGSFKIGNTDFSKVVFPAGVTNCQMCHDPASGAAQADAWMKPNRAACGACHDNVDFATGKNHSSNTLAQTSDELCSLCHPAKGGEFDTSVAGAHLDPRFSKNLPGTVFQIVGVTGGAPGKSPSVTFTVQDKAGNPIAPSTLDRLAAVLAGPTSDYTNFISEDARQAKDNGDGSYTWNFQGKIPADATGTYSMSLEGYRGIKLAAGTARETTMRDAGMNPVSYFSLDGSDPQPRRQVVAIEKCNACHLQLEMHGRNRNQIDHCVQCHNTTQTDGAGRPASAGPAQGIMFKIMIHRLHTGASGTQPFMIYGGGGSPTDFSNVLFPGDRRNCAKCHVNGSYQLPLPDGVAMVSNPRGYYNPVGPVAAACLGCHTKESAASHALAMTTSSLGESCDVCHGPSGDFSLDKVHAR